MYIHTHSTVSQTTTKHNNTTTQHTTTTTTRHKHNHNHNHHNNLRSHFGSSRGHSWPGLSQWLLSPHHRLRQCLLLVDGHPRRVGVGLLCPNPRRRCCFFGHSPEESGSGVEGGAGTILCLAATNAGDCKWTGGADPTSWNDSWNRLGLCLCPRS